MYYVILKGLYITIINNILYETIQNILVPMQTCQRFNNHMTGGIENTAIIFEKILPRK